MSRLPFLAGSLLAAIAVSACNSTQDVLEPSAIAASPPAPGALQAEGSVVPVQAASTNTTAALNPGIAARTRLRFDPIVVCGRLGLGRRQFLAGSTLFNGRVHRPLSSLPLLRNARHAVGFSGAALPASPGAQLRADILGRKAE